MLRVENRSLLIEDLPGSPDGPHVLRLTGPIVLNTLSEFQDKVRRDRSHHLILDFTNVSYVDSTGIGALVSLYVRHHRDGWGVSLVGASDRVLTVLRLARVEPFFRFFNSLAEAQAAPE
jgi:anti-sigma B factor antagonist